MKNISYNATDNVRSFIEDFFSEKYRQIPLLLWDVVRNGLVHSFYPESFIYQKSGQSSDGYIKFQFYVKDRNFPSHIKKDKDTIWISINIIELYRVLEKAIEDYLEKLKHDETLQDKFKRAWSSIEDYMDKADSNQSEEVKEILDYFDSAEAAKRSCGRGAGFRCNPAWHIAAHHAPFSATAFCRTQLILRTSASPICT